MKAYPLKFEPIYKQRIWGGQKLREVFGKDLPVGKLAGRSVSDLEKAIVSKRKK
jgi:mannose-6-phosphate isomerase